MAHETRQTIWYVLVLALVIALLIVRISMPRTYLSSGDGVARDLGRQAGEPAQSERPRKTARDAQAGWNGEEESYPGCDAWRTLAAEDLGTN